MGALPPNENDGNGDNTTNALTWSGTRSEARLGDYAWYQENSKVPKTFASYFGKRDGYKCQAHEVKTKKPNA